MDQLEEQLSRAGAEPSDELDRRIAALAQHASAGRGMTGKKEAGTERGGLGRLYPLLLAASLALATGLAVGYLFGRGAERPEPITPVAAPYQPPASHESADAFAVQHVIAHVEPSFFDFTIDPAGPLGRITTATDSIFNYNGDTP